MESNDYQRGYNKGYSTGSRRSDARADNAERIAAESVARAARAEAEQGFGKCIDCRRWAWGGNGAMWGVCTPPDSRMHNREVLWFRSDGEFSTSQSFGCVMFAAKD